MINRKEMFNMKRLLAFLLTVMICAAVLSACGSTQNTGSDTQNTQSSSGEATIEETTVLDEQGIVAVAKSLGKYEGEWLSCDHALVLDVTNNTEKAVSVSLKRLSVNGCFFDDSMGVDVQPGETTELPAMLDDITLENYGITTVADLEFSVGVEDAESYQTLFESDPVTIKTSAYEGFEYQYNESGTVMYDADGVKIIAMDGLHEHDFFGPYINLCVINQTDKNIGVRVADSAVNGENIALGTGSYTPAGKRSINILSIEGEDRPEKVESFTLSFSIEDWDSGDVIIEKTDPVTITFG